MANREEELQKKREEAERKARRGEIDPTHEFTFQVIKISKLSFSKKLVCWTQCVAATSNHFFRLLVLMHMAQFWLELLGKKAQLSSPYLAKTCDDLIQKF